MLAQVFKSFLQLRQHFSNSTAVFGALMPLAVDEATVETGAAASALPLDAADGVRT